MKMEEKIKAGDIVRLKGGSPNMTVTYADNEGNVTCTWFLSRDWGWDGPFREVFSLNALEKVS